MLVPLLTRPRVAQFIKYTVYLSLMANLLIYLVDDYQAMLSALPENAPLMDLYTRFSTSIDTAAWMGIIILFELETYTLPNEAFTVKVMALLRTGRAICYLLIFSAAYGYTVEAMQNYEFTEVAGLSDVCQIADQDRWLQMDSIDYEEITSLSCDSLSDDQVFYQFDDDPSLIGASLLSHVQYQGLLDICNSFVWLLVIALIEIEVLLQSADRFASRWLNPVRQVKTLFYLVLIANGVMWGITGYYIYAWDAFLWIFGFWVIELNMAEWEQDRLEELREDKLG
ncbi:MAG: hypothetical protein ACI9SC_001320 [Gammaproteobacteria bacterium]|jgi:hypothetical protein